MKNFSTLAIILGHKNFGEADKLIFLYSQELGKIKVIAKGSRRINSKFSGHLETLNIVEALLYFGPKNIILTEINTVKNFSKLAQSDLEKIMYSLQIAEITNKLIYENQNLNNLMELIENTLDHLQNCNKHRLITQSYIIKLLDKIGYIPDFTQINTKMEEKYLRFFNFIQKESLNKIAKIKLSKEEENKIQTITSKLLQTATN